MGGAQGRAGEGRSCNPQTEFRLGFVAGAVDPFRWAQLYKIAAERASKFEAALRANGISVRDALDEKEQES